MDPDEARRLLFAALDAHPVEQGPLSEADQRTLEELLDIFEESRKAYDERST
jgi:hypothetical protein